MPSRGPSDHRDLTYWMKRSLEELANLRSELTNHTVHDLRVALRRCRSVASVMKEIDPHPDWEEMRGCARKLFRSLGDLRDAHVMAEWLNQLHPEDDVLKRQCLAQQSSRLHFECSIIALPIEAKAERRVKDGGGIERKLRSVQPSVVPLSVGAIGAYVMTGQTGARPVS